MDSPQTFHIVLPACKPLNLICQTYQLISEPYSDSKICNLRGGNCKHSTLCFCHVKLQGFCELRAQHNVECLW